MIRVGVDEVGRGCWAGPVVAGAVVLPAFYHLDGLRDSKKIRAAERSRLDRAIRQQAVAIGLGWVSNAEVDRWGLAWAIRESGLRALAGLGRQFDHVVLDGIHNYLADQAYTSEVVVAADDTVPAVSAAAIIAKVARDRYMKYMSIRYPDYGFESHVGYGTAHHRRALATHGITPIHRQCVRPVREVQ